MPFCTASPPLPDRGGPVTDVILVLNAGSSSLKFAVYPKTEGANRPLLRGKISGIGTKPVFSARDATGLGLLQHGFAPIDPKTTADGLIPNLLDWVQAHLSGATICAAGHRVVHGGPHHAGPAVVTKTLLFDLEALVPLAPMHQPHNLAAIRCLAAKAPDMPQVACFDTSFHHTQDRLAQIFALPRALTDEGIIRYGFHGLSYEYIASTLPSYLGNRADGRVVVAHLGSGASICAMQHRRSVATSMGLTVLDGLMMGRRCGTLDPGVVLYLMEENHMSAQQIKTLLYRQSGLLGVSGISNDMATLEQTDAPEAKQAIDLFCYRAAREVASLAVTIGGLDALIFTAGIGENSATVRADICARLRWMGVRIETAANVQNAARLSPRGSDIEVLVIPTDEETIIAQATRALTCGAGAAAQT